MNISEYIKNNTLKIIVKPNSTKNEIIGYDESRRAVKVNIKEKAQNNKANIEVVKFFSKLTKKKVHIISGLTSRKKVIKFG